MGEHDVSLQSDETELQGFMKALLDDVQTLEKMLDAGVFETDISRIGAEQELFLVDGNMVPACISEELLRRIDDPRFTTELAQFNLEANLTPVEFKHSALRQMEEELETLMEKARRRANEMGGDILLVGILPTLQRSHLVLDNLTPFPRYFQMNEALKKFRGEAFNVSIKGIDELNLEQDNIMLEACNTSFQIHFQVSPRRFANLYNVCQLITAPVLAAAVNSPMLLNKRLWHETRLALYQKSVDTRSDTLRQRAQRPRVSFGDKWIQESVLEVFRDDITRFRLLLAKKLDDIPSSQLWDEGKIPPLKALCLHNSTVWRWNRACYGISPNGQPHLRLEMRALPAGPSTVDEMANMAFALGLLSQFANQHPNLKETMAFDDVQDNFYKAAAHGLSAQMVWLDGKTYAAQDLVLEQLLPAAKAGLDACHIDPEDSERYLSILRQRVERNRTGARWILESYVGLGSDVNKDLRCRSIAAAMLENQTENKPVHTWELAQLRDSRGWFHSFRTVGQFMSTELFTVAPDDIVDLAAQIMKWEKIRHIPVEDSAGKLQGVISHRSVLRYIAQHPGEVVVVRDIMRTHPITVTPETPTLEAIRIMKENNIGCLPVVEGEKLVGIITEFDFITLAGKLLEETLKEVD